MTKEKILEAYRNAVAEVLVDTAAQIDVLVVEKNASNSAAQREKDAIRLEEIRRKLQS